MSRVDRSMGSDLNCSGLPESKQTYDSLPHRSRFSRQAGFYDYRVVLQDLVRSAELSDLQLQLDNPAGVVGGVPGRRPPSVSACLHLGP